MLRLALAPNVDARRKHAQQAIQLLQADFQILVLADLELHTDAVTIRPVRVLHRLHRQQVLELLAVLAVVRELHVAVLRPTQARTKHRNGVRLRVRALQEATVASRRIGLGIARDLLELAVHEHHRCPGDRHVTDDNACRERLSHGDEQIQPRVVVVGEVVDSGRGAKVDEVPVARCGFEPLEERAPHVRLHEAGERVVRECLKGLRDLHLDLLEGRLARGLLALRATLADEAAVDVGGRLLLLRPGRVAQGGGRLAHHVPRRVHVLALEEAFELAPELLVADELGERPHGLGEPHEFGEVDEGGHVGLADVGPGHGRHTLAPPIGPRLRHRRDRLLELAAVHESLGRGCPLLNLRRAGHQELLGYHFHQHVEALHADGVAPVVDGQLRPDAVPVHAHRIVHRPRHEANEHALAALGVVGHVYVEVLGGAELGGHLEDNVVLGVLPLEDPAVVPDDVTLAVAREALVLGVDEHEGRAWDGEVAARAGRARRRRAGEWGGASGASSGEVRVSGRRGDRAGRSERSERGEK